MKKKVVSYLQAVHHLWQHSALLIICHKRAASHFSLCTLKGSTPLNKLSIGTHANIVLRVRNSTPLHVTIFWKFWWQKLLKQRLNFNSSLLWCCWSKTFFEIKASEQRHRLFSLACSPPHHIRPGPGFMRLRSTQIRIQTFCYYMNNDQATVKPLNFARDLISLILQVMKIREIKYPRKFKFYIDSNSKASRLAKLSTCKDGCNLQFAKLSPREIKVFYSILSQFYHK